MSGCQTLQRAYQSIQKQITCAEGKAQERKAVLRIFMDLDTSDEDEIMCVSKSK